jgi:hypothetical protein
VTRGAGGQSGSTPPNNMQNGGSMPSNGGSTSR